MLEDRGIIPLMWKEHTSRHAPGVYTNACEGITHCNLQNAVHASELYTIPEYRVSDACVHVFLAATVVHRRYDSSGVQASSLPSLRPLSFACKE